MKKTISTSLCFLITAVLLLVLLPSVPAQAAETEDAAVQTVEVGIPVEEHPELFLTRSMPTHGEGKIAVFLIEFPDYPNENPVATQEYYEKLYFSGGLETKWGETTVADFFKEQSYGKLQLSGQVFDWYTAKHERSYYDNRKGELVMEAAEYYRAQGVDFSQFDGDGDGTIDSIVFHFTGETSAQLAGPWWHGVRYSHYRGFGEIENLKFTTIVQVYENADKWTDTMISTICHELMHNLGMPDLYQYKGGPSRYTTDLMSGSMVAINPYIKMLLGWIDTVQVITTDTENIRLEPYGIDPDGKAVIVTDEYNGLFDEFYLVAYRTSFENQQAPTAVIWHIDARLTEDGASFLNHNLTYDPYPDKDYEYSVDNPSQYLFIEEISANPKYDFISAISYDSQKTAFVYDSVLGPNNIPSSDTHDGEYTGIQIDNFVEHNKEYLTFDVSFVEDTVAPVVTTNEGDLQFQETITLKFNEHIYAGANWENIRVADLEGILLDATIILPPYPRNEIEITFKDKSYEKGYQIIFPKGAIRDSAGNSLESVTLTASLMENQLFPISEIQLPDAGEHLRDNSKAFFFPGEDEIIVITGLSKDDGCHTSLEFMRLDYDGNVIKQLIVENPFENSKITHIAETGDSCYIVFCEEYSNMPLLFCLDKYGSIKWTNDNHNKSFNTNKIFKRADGLVVQLLTGGLDNAAHISSKTGKVETFQINGQRGLMGACDLSDGKILLWDSRLGQGDIINAETYEVEGQVQIPSLSGGISHIERGQVRDDGTIILYIRYFKSSYSTRIVLLDSDLKVCKEILLESAIDEETILYRDINWIKNDGFCEIVWANNAIGGRNQFHIRRYDRYLNLMWESDIEANFVHYFKSSTGEIMAYRSVMESEEKCYIDYYGSEEKFKTAHVHDLVHTEEIPATCRSEGRAEYWQCVDCGVFFSDEGQTVVTDLQTLVLPIGEHTEGAPVAENSISPTCTEPGSYDSVVYCTVCKLELGRGTVIVDALGHTEAIDAAVAPTCASDGLTEGKHCSTCNIVLAPQQEVAALGHSYESVVTAPICEDKGYTTHTCSVCGDSYSDTEVAATGHSYGEWTVTKEATRKEVGEETRTCACGATETREIPMVEGVNPAVIVVIVIVALGVITVVVILILKKKK